MNKPVTAAEHLSMDIAAEAEAVISGVELDPTLREQMDLEDGMIEAGKARYWRLVAEAASKPDRGADGIPARTAIRLSEDKLAAAIQAWVESFVGKRGRQPSGLRSIKAIDPETCAFITLRVIFNHLASSAQAQLPKLATKLGVAITDEATLRQFEERHPAIVTLINQRLSSKSRIHYRRVLKASLNRKAPDIVEQNLPDADYLTVGLPLIELVETATGLIKTTRTKASSTVELSEECKKFFEDVHTRAQYFQPVYGPTIVPPRPWQGFRNGGYHYGLAGKLTLIKTRDKEHRKLLEAADMPIVYAGLNALQNTGWRINLPVLEIMDYAARVDSGIGGLPLVGDMDIPTVPADIPLKKEDRTPEQQERLDRWRRIAAAAYKENDERKSNRHSVSQTLALAQQYAGHETIYFPHTLDFRGRAYPVTSYLTPQGTDYQKALLQFAEAKPISHANRGLFWLAVHGANCMADCPITGAKLDKGKVEDRVSWVHANSDRIWQVARNPLDNLDFWSKADSPWQFLAFCFEWEAVCDAMAKGETPVSSLPIALDGSCNGLQHFSAMMRDEIGGAAVNLVPQEVPADIYTKVKTKLIERLVALAAEQEEQPEIEEVDEEEDDAEIIDTGVEGITGKKGKKKVRKLSPIAAARTWVDSGQVDRGMCKRPVMTTPYGSKKFGIKGQIREELRKRKFKFANGVDGFAECGFLAGEIVDAIGRVVVKAREVMDWLQESAAVLTRIGTAVVWTAPSGFIVRQAYPQTALKRVDTFFHGQRFVPQLLVERPGTLDRNRQTNGVSPNFVHSMDGSAMIITVYRCAVERAIQSFAMIHDSFATHAADTEQLAFILRDVFVRMYTEKDPFEDFVAAVFAAIEGSDEELKDPPAKGKLDLSRVRDSLYFFL